MSVGLSQVITPPTQVPWINVVRTGADKTGVVDSTTAFNTALTNGSTALVPAGTYRIAGTVLVPDSKQLRFASGVTINLVGVGTDYAFTLARNAEITADGIVTIVAMNGASIAGIIQNQYNDGTQETAWISNCNMSAQTGAVVTGPMVDLQALFVNSGISRCIINCNKVAPNGLRIAGSLTPLRQNPVNPGTGTGFGPVYAKDIWCFLSTQDCFNITEPNPSLGGGSFWGENLTGENCASNFANFAAHGHGGIWVNLDHFHSEDQQTTAVGEISAAIRLDGVEDAVIDGIDALASPITRKRVIDITSSAFNQQISVRNIRNPNSIDPVIFDGTGAGQTIALASAGRVMEYRGPANSAVAGSNYGTFRIGGDLRRSVQTIAYAASVTPDPRIGEYIALGPLTGNITIANPVSTKSFAGQKMNFKITHDGTAGAYVITWDTLYKRAGGAFVNTNTAGAVDTIDFEYDGTSWNETSRAMNLS